MAGNFPDVPAPRMAYDRDGTIAVRVMEASGSVIDVTTTELQEANNESGSAWNIYSKGSSGPNEIVSGVLIFPELRDISGIWWGMSNNAVSGLDFKTSTDTTSGFDGTWVSQGAPSYTSITASNARQNIIPYAVNGIKAIKLYGSYRGSGGGSSLALGLHLYGTISSYTGMDTLRIWHPTLDQPLDSATSTNGAYLDWGDVARGTSQDRQFRVKNNSATLTSNSVTISSEALTDTTPNLGPQFTYSDGGAFSANINIGNISPGAISPVITVRRSTDVSATLSIWSLRTVIEAASWS